MSPQSDRRQGGAEEEKPRSNRRWEEAPRKRAPHEDESKEPAARARKGVRRSPAFDWEDDFDDADDTAVVDDDLDDLDDTSDFDDIDALDDTDDVGDSDEERS